MKKKLKIARKELLGNKGSGLAVVMMAMVLITLMAATLLNMTYMGYKIKAEERKQKEDYNIVTTAMDEIRAGVQGVVSQAIERAYKDMLVNGTSFDVAFCDVFDEIYNSYVFKMRENLNLTSYFNVTGGDDLESTDTEIVIEPFSLTYTNSAGNTTTVKTDIVITVPGLAEWDYNKLVQYRNWRIE